MRHMSAWLNGESVLYINKLFRRKSMYVYISYMQCTVKCIALSKVYSIKLKCVYIYIYISFIELSKVYSIKFYAV
jgi:hypothetical protein